MLHTLGAASYSLYLTHIVVFLYIASYFRRLGLPAYSLPPLVTAALWLVGCVLVGLVVYVAFERPVTRALQRRIRNRPAASPSPAVREGP